MSLYSSLSPLRVSCSPHNFTDTHTHSFFKVGVGRVLALTRKFFQTYTDKMYFISIRGSDNICHCSVVIEDGM